MRPAGETMPETPEPESAPTTVLLDAHVHCHPRFDLAAFLDHAQRNFARAAAALGSAVTVGLLVMTEGRDERAFERLLAASGGGSPSGWKITRTAERTSLVARRGGGPPVVLVAGQQVRLRRGLELLALGCNPGLPDGGDLESTAAAIRAAGALAVLPWGFGKWWLRRGRTVAELLRTARPEELLLADSGARARLLPYPRLLARAAELGFRVIAGTDPLPLASEIARPGSYGCLLEGPLPLDRPAAALAELLGGAPPAPPRFGTGRPLAGFLRDQLSMQWRRGRA